MIAVAGSGNNNLLEYSYTQSRQKTGSRDSFLVFAPAARITPEE
jgi:hypothetical protein